MWKRSHDRLLLLQQKLVSNIKTLEAFSIHEAIEIATKLLNESMEAKNQVVKLQQTIEQSTLEQKDMRAAQQRLRFEVQDKDKKISELDIERKQLAEQLRLQMLTSVAQPRTSNSTIFNNGNVSGKNDSTTSPANDLSRVLLPHEVVASIRREKLFDIEVIKDGILQSLCSVHASGGTWCVVCGVHNTLISFA